VELLTIRPIGLVRSPFSDKQSAPRQPSVARGIEGRIELFDDARYDVALEDLETWSHIWVLFWFHLNSTWKPKVRPPRSIEKRGVFATRAPHRPNPIGLSLLELCRVEGRVVHVRDVDILDGTPVLDIKPYVAYADTAMAAVSGWLGEAPDQPKDAGPIYAVTWAEAARERARWLRKEHQVDIEGPVERALSLGATPHAYRRIRRDGAHLRMAYRDWRILFDLDGRDVTIFGVKTGYRARVLNDPLSEPSGETSLDVHRAFVARFG
jgi:tRNA-Thr(GGU) m(6)t(6)A37 methyltransferase TsaA